MVRADDQLGRVFQNLIENALKYRGESPPNIHVSSTSLVPNGFSQCGTTALGSTCPMLSRSFPLSTAHIGMPNTKERDLVWLRVNESSNAMEVESGRSRLQTPVPRSSSLFPPSLQLRLSRDKYPKAGTLPKPIFLQLFPSKCYHHNPNRH